MTQNIPCTAKEIKAGIELVVADRFMNLEVPELFFWSIDLEYIASDSVAFGVRL